MRLFGGKALVAAGGQSFYDFDDRWIPLVEQPRQRFEPEAVIFTGIMDGGNPGCVWHRLMLDASIPAETGVQVWSAAADDAAALNAPPGWNAEPAPYPRGDGSEIPGESTDLIGAYRTWELLFQKPTGRYLRLRLAITGNGRATPRLRALRAYYPRFSYLERYLPAVYREDDVSASFLDRFLANTEGVATTIEGRIATAQLLFDPRTSPTGALDWLASWFGVVLDPAWGELKRRLLLSHAMDLFQWRGTVRGLHAALALVLEDHPDPSIFSDTPGLCAQRTRIVELYQTKLTPAIALGDPTSTAGPVPFGRWQPADGADALHQGYRDALTAAGLPAAPATRFPVAVPSAPEAATVWVNFSQRSLGFVPTADSSSLQLWQQFLALRYVREANLNSAYGWVGATAIQSFDIVGLLSEVPARDPALTDWYQFQTVVLPSAQRAARFRVLLPVSTQTRLTSTASDLAAQVQLAQQIIDLEKPAHTVYDVKFYWDAFRVGEARLGLDTFVDLGSRSPSLLSDAVLNQTYVGQSVVGTRMAEVAATRAPILPVIRPCNRSPQA
jgi:phage tail-like protein